MNSNTENKTATFAAQNSVVQQATVKGEYASLGTLKMYYKITARGDH